MADLVTGEALAAYLTKIGAGGSAVAVADTAAETASAYVAAYCTRLTASDPVPPVVAKVAMHLAARLACNPRATRTVSADGQSADLAPVGFTFLESVMLNRYRRRAA